MAAHSPISVMTTISSVFRRSDKNYPNLPASASINSIGQAKWNELLECANENRRCGENSAKA